VEYVLVVSSDLKTRVGTFHHKVGNVGYFKTRKGFQLANSIRKYKLTEILRCAISLDA